jgi:hypothetical protein
MAASVGGIRLVLTIHRRNRAANPAQLKRAEQFVVPEDIATRVRLLLQQQFDQPQRFGRLRVVAHRDGNARLPLEFAQDLIRVNRIVGAINHQRIPLRRPEQIITNE